MQAFIPMMIEIFKSTQNPTSDEVERLEATFKCLFEDNLRIDSMITHHHKTIPQSVPLFSSRCFSTTAYSTESTADGLSSLSSIVSDALLNVLAYEKCEAEFRDVQRHVEEKINQPKNLKKLYEKLEAINEEASIYSSYS